MVRNALLLFLGRPVSYTHLLAKPENIIVSALDPNKLEKKAKEIGFVAAKSNREVVEKSDIIFLAVKPQYLGDVMVDIRPAVDASKAFISIVAGWTNVKLKACLLYTSVYCRVSR